MTFLFVLFFEIHFAFEMCFFGVFFGGIYLDVGDLGESTLGWKRILTAPGVL